MLRPQPPVLRGAPYGLRDVTVALVGARLRRAIIAQHSCAPTAKRTPALHPIRQRARRSGPWPRPQPHPKNCHCHQSRRSAQPTLAVAGTAGSYKNAFGGVPSPSLPAPARRRGDPAFRLHRPPGTDVKTRDRPAQTIPCLADNILPAPRCGPARKIRARPSTRQKHRP